MKPNFITAQTRLSVWMRVPYRHRNGRQGFALVVTLSLMVLITVIAVGLLTLTSTTLRTRSQSTAQTEANANARLALMLAIGELQKQTGADTRVTARADVLDENHPPILGVWKSWEGTNHTSTGRPVSPGSNYREVKNTRFLVWLVSGSTTSQTSPTDLPDVLPGTGKVTLVGEGSVGHGPDRDKLQIHLPPTTVTTSKGKGSIAWWIGGENQKARLPKPYKPANDTVAGWAGHTKSHTVADPKVFRMEALLADANPADKAVSLRQSDLIADAGAMYASTEFFHDLSTTSTGLLTNTSTGGWRKDLSLVTENWDTLPASGLPFFRINANSTTSVSKPTAAVYQAPQSIFYPWSDYWAGPNESPIYQHGAVSSWHNLKHYATAYKRPTTFPGFNIANKNTSFQYLHEIRTPMIIARAHLLFSHRTVRQENDPDPTKRNTYHLELLITPVITMWNPYNVAITSPEQKLQIVMAKPLPCAFRHYNRNGYSISRYRKLIHGHTYNSPTPMSGDYSVMPPGTNQLSYFLPPAFTLAPGETRVFSPIGIVGIGDASLDLSPGFRPGTGHSVNISSYAGPLDATSKIKVDVVFDARFKEAENKQEYVGGWLDMMLDVGGGHYLLVNRMQYSRTVANQYWPPIPAAELASPSAEEINGIWQPFLSAVFGSRISGPSSTALPGKGLLQTSPLVSYVRVEEGYTTAKGGAHPANAASDFSFFKHTANDDKLPNANNTNHRGFIISGFTSADGLSRVVLGEIPLQPLVSLAELQNWDLRSQNGVPPFQLNVVANSDASPLLPIDNVVNTEGTTNLQHDDSYCANHLLFDDWFFSSIAPKSANLGAPTASETLEKTYTDFVSGTDPLPNRAYRSITADAAVAQTTGGPKKLFDAHANKADSWQTIASRLEVEGMFNVNSTSVNAWRALLGHARNQKIPHHTEGGMNLSPETNHSFSRFNIAGDVKAGELGMSGGFSQSSELTGYRVFDDALLDSLAEEIVKQVRLRGPFLSLSEFVNRQLSSDKTLALAGAIQTALNEMSIKAGANDPYQKLKSVGLSQNAGDPNDPKLEGAGYVFPEAAIGKSTYGLPGWTRQADVLRPLAPILSARDDAFTIRAYGDARDASGKITARATCEATVRRTREYVDSTDAPDITSPPKAAANLTFGRRYQIISFRWLTDKEI